MQALADGHFKLVIEGYSNEEQEEEGAGSGQLPSDGQQAVPEGGEGTAGEAFSTATAAAAPQPAEEAAAAAGHGHGGGHGTAGQPQPEPRKPLPMRPRTRILEMKRAVTV